MSPSPPMRIIVALIILAIVVEAAQHPTVPRPADPFADPKHDPYNPLRYIVNNTLTAVALACYATATLCQFFEMWKFGGKFMLSMSIGGVCYCIGLIARFLLHPHPESKGVFIVEYLFIILSPCAFIAAVYVVTGRLSRYLNTGKYLLIRPTRVTAIFLSSDIITFLIQAAGGGFSLSQDSKTINVGQKIFLVGLILQVISFASFICMLTVFTWRVRKFEPAIWRKDQRKPWHSDWRTLLVAVYVACVGILIRSIFRTVEFSEGFQGHLNTTEAFFYCLDALPLFFSLTIFVPFWPGRFIPTPHHPSPEPVLEGLNDVEMGQKQEDKSEGVTLEEATSPAKD